LPSINEKASGMPEAFSFIDGNSHKGIASPGRPD